MAIIENLFSLQGSAALVTGASGGIGSAVAIALADAGANVALHGTHVKNLEEVRRRIDATGGRATILTADLSDLDACKKLISSTHQALGRLDILFNNAGMNRRKPIAEITAEDFEKIVAVNLRSVLFLSQTAQPIMKAQGGGKIINIGSLTSHIALGTSSVYGATKAAVAQLTKTMAVEWAVDNIQVNCIAPGFIITPLTEKSVWGDAYKKNWMLQRIPARRGGKPEDLAGAAIFLSSAASDYVTGHTLNVDGGTLAGGSWEPDKDQELIDS